MKTGFYISAVLLLLIICLPCILQCVQRLINKSTKTVLLVEQKGGDTGIQLESRTVSTAQLVTTDRDVVAIVGRKPWQE